MHPATEGVKGHLHTVVYLCLSSPFYVTAAHAWLNCRLAPYAEWHCIMGTHLDEAVAGYYVPPWACSPAHRTLRVFYRLSLLLLLKVVIYLAHVVDFRGVNEYGTRHVTYCSPKL
jgi:hypothetical protein